MKQTSITFKGTPGQKKAFRELVRNATNQAINLAFQGIPANQDDWQRVLEHGDCLRKAILSGIVTETGALMAVKFADEERICKHGYPSSYRQAAPIEQQIDILRSHWPRLNPDRAIHWHQEVYLRLQLPYWIEDPFIWIRPGFFSSNYGEEIEEILKALAKAYDGKFTNSLEGKLGPEYLRQYEHTVTMLNQVIQQQPDSDLLVMPCNFGVRYPVGDGKHTTSSVRRAREKFLADEFGIGLKDGATMLLTNPDRLRHYKDLWIDLPGDEVFDRIVKWYGGAPFLSFEEDGIFTVSARGVNTRENGCASISAFVPQQA